jgi:hypothetical protein
MPHVVTDNCHSRRFTDRVTAYPLACFHADDMPDDQAYWIEINAERALQLPVISEKQTPLPTAEKRKAELGF